MPLSLITSLVVATGPALAATPDELARQVATTAGNPYLADEIHFTFVVDVDGQEKVRRTHTWWPRAGVLLVDSEALEVRIEHTGDLDLTSAAEDPIASAATWQKAAPQADPQLAARAWSSFINDAYWLLAACKTTDPGVVHAIDEEGRLELSFDEVGLTPGDRYWMEVDPDTGRVLAWEFRLQGGRAGYYEWLDYAQHGPLLLSTRKVGPDGKMVVHFEDVSAK